MSERQFRLVSVLLAAGVVALLLAAVLLWYVPIRVGGTGCGHAADSHAGVEWHHLDGPLSPTEERENAACDAAGEPLWLIGLAGTGVGAAAVVAALGVVVAVRVRQVCAQLP